MNLAARAVHPNAGYASSGRRHLLCEALGSASMTPNYSRITVIPGTLDPETLAELKRAGLSADFPSIGGAVSDSKRKAGYDPTAFVAAKHCRSDRILTHRQLKALLDTLPNDDHGIRRELRGRHLYIHAADWLRWNAEQERQETEATDPSAIEEAVINQRRNRRRGR
jgi:hypothetical protein